MYALLEIDDFTYSHKPASYTNILFPLRSRSSPGSTDEYDLRYNLLLCKRTFSRVRYINRTFVIIIIIIFF